MINLKYIESFKSNNSWDYDKLRDMFHVKQYGKYTLIKYKKSLINAETIKQLGLFRSVILDEEKVVSLSPPKSLPYDENKSYKIIEFVEGTMINSWYDNEESKWLISSKSVIGADCKFYDTQDKNFSELFNETCRECDFDMNVLDKNIIYSFVFQHPNNKIINKIDKPKLYLIASYKELEPNVFIPVSQQPLKNVLFPQQYIGDINEIKEKLTMVNETPITNMGIVLKQDNCIFHSKIRSAYFEYVKKLKTNHSKLIYTYITLLKSGNNIENHLLMFPENKDKFNVFSDEFSKLIDYLLKTYYGVYVNKKIDNETISGPISYHLRKIHNNYIRYLRDFNLNTTSGDIYNYIINLETKQIIYILNIWKKETNI